MNIKKILSKAIAFGLIAVTTATVGVPGIKAKATEVVQEKSGWKTLVLICPRAEIKKTSYTSAGTTLMYASEVEKVKEDAKKLEAAVNEYSVGRANMTVDVKVSEKPIENKSLSMAYGPYIGAYNVQSILDTYAPVGAYDQVMLVYRNKDYTTSLGTANVIETPINGNIAANGAIYTTVKLDDADHSMYEMDKQVPMYLMDRFVEGTYQYLNQLGCKLDAVNPPVYDGVSDSYQFNKYKRNYYRWYLFGLKWDANSIGGITEDMWNMKPTSK